MITFIQSWWIVLIWFFIQLAIEVFQIYHSSAPGRGCNLSEWYSNIWNMLDAVRLILHQVYVVQTITVGITELENQIFALLVLVSFMGMLGYLRFF